MSTLLRRSVLVVSLLLSTLALAKEVAGVQVADSVTVGDAALKLNGAGVRTKFVFKVYVGALYLQTPSTDGKAILAADAPRQFVQVFLRNVDKAKIDETWKEGFEQRGGTKDAAMKEKLDKLLAITADVKEKDKWTFTYVPGKGTTIAANGVDKLTLEGKDFADMMFSGWVGDKPVDKDLRDAVLSGK